MNYIVLDVECSGALKNSAHPFDPENRLLLVGTRQEGASSIRDIEYSGLPYGNSLLDLGLQLSGKDLFVVGFNIKFDLHWLRRYNARLGRKVKIWDCQLAEFILENQQNPYPSLETSCLKHGLPLKKSTLVEYLDSGVDVDKIPLPELIEYLKGDLISTEELFLKQLELIDKGGYWNLFDLQCQDLLVLADMEYNGMKYDLKKSALLAQSSKEAENEIIECLNRLVTGAPFPINWASNDHLSAILYGGNIKYVVKEHVGLFKTGSRAGMDKFRNADHSYVFPRLVNPSDDSKLAKEGFWSTAEDVLKELKAGGLAKDIIDQVLKLSQLQKLRGTYLEGIPKRFEEYGWEEELVHGQINQCVTITGRTSSSKPNLQNIPPESKECFISRYD